MALNPAVRANAARDTLEFTEAYRLGTCDMIRGTIPDASLDAIDHTPGFSWLDIEHDHWLMDGTMAVLGRHDAIDCWRSNIANITERPLLQSFVDGGVRIFGGKPGALLKLIPKGWSLVYRDFCVPSFQRLGDGRAEVRFEQIAPRVLEHPGYLHCWHGVCAGIFDLEKPSHGKLEFDIRTEEALAIAHFSWRP